MLDQPWPLSPSKLVYDQCLIAERLSSKDRSRQRESAGIVNEPLVEGNSRLFGQKGAAISIRNVWPIATGTATRIRPRYSSRLSLAVSRASSHTFNSSLATGRLACVSNDKVVRRPFHPLHPHDRFELLKMSTAWAPRKFQNSLGGGHRTPLGDAKKGRISSRRSTLELVVRASAEMALRFRGLLGASTGIGVPSGEYRLFAIRFYQ
jgi:hypothetical protein